MKPKIFLTVAVALVCTCAQAQVNSGSNGSDGAFNPATNTVINMTDHPNGIYQYTSVTISNGVTVTFIPNANNSPVTWLVQSNCLINGSVSVTGQNGNGDQGGTGGPAGYRGGNGAIQGSSGLGPGGGLSGTYGGNASYATVGGLGTGTPGPIYGNTFLIPLLGGSGGGGSTNQGIGGGGGGGAILVVASGTITISSAGGLVANGGVSTPWIPYQGYLGGGGSGGAIRLVASKIEGAGVIGATGGQGSGYNSSAPAGNGRVRIDCFENNFSGSISGSFSQGSQFIITPSSGQLPQLTVSTVGGVAVSASPTGVLSTPDAVLSAQQNNPIPVVVNCANLPLNTQVTVSVKPANGAAVSATGLNSSGTLMSSTATISIVIPRGGGLIYATAATSN
jgi:hypothetical protein